LKDIRFPDGKFLQSLWNKEREAIEKWNLKYSNWTMKKDKIYWIGGVTGGRVDADSYQKLHRYRWVKYANMLNTSLYNKTEVKFSDTVFCKPGGCEAVNGSVPFIEKQPFEQNWEYKVLIDLEGFAWSERFKKLLYSNSVVFRHEPIFVEFWQDWVKPWVHYIPIKFDFSDVEEKLDQVIAGNKTVLSVIQLSTEFIHDNLRVEDIYCYIYRLLLDYAKLMRYNIKQCKDTEIHKE